ncbi:MAG: hypothetical protein WA060_01255 [Minisyncoccia bacterium]
MTMLGLDEDNPSPKRNPTKTMLGISLGVLTIVVATLLALSNLESFREIVKKLF